MKEELDRPENKDIKNEIFKLKKQKEKLRKQSEILQRNKKIYKERETSELDFGW